jgi:hypothetical protein
MRAALLNRISLLAMFTMAAPATLMAQPAQDAHLRNDCRLAAQILRTGHPAPHTEWAYRAITKCVDSGPAVLIEKWRGTLPGDSMEMRLLAGTSRYFPQQAVFDAVAAAALNANNTTYQRFRAMRLLASFAMPGIYLSEQDLLNPPARGGIRTFTFSGDQATSQVGELGGVKPEVRALMQRIQDEASDPTLRRVAEEYVKFLAPLEPLPR